MNLQEWLDKYLKDPYNPEINFRLGLSYDVLGQTASAAGFYLRSVEFGTNDLLKYEALLKMALCFERQGNRVQTIEGILLRAISLLPKKPQAYYLLSRLYERNQKWHESYTFAILGEEFATDNSFTLTNLEYQDRWVFKFERAVSGWWIGLHDESISLLKYLNANCNLDESHKICVINNLKNLHSDCYTYFRYTQDKHGTMKYKFPSSKEIKQNYSQTYQDLFVLYMNEGKENGTYLEIGSGDPIYNNNSYLLENSYNWKGVSIEFNESLCKKHEEIRKNSVICNDARNVDYADLLRKNYSTNVIDYLQIDVDPPDVSYKVLTSIPFKSHKFRVITFEHDYYADVSRSYRQKSRDYLRNLGYELVIPDVSNTDWSPFEDWWVHPELVPKYIVKKIKKMDERNMTIHEYMFGP